MAPSLNDGTEPTIDLIAIEHDVCNSTLIDSNPSEINRLPPSGTAASAYARSLLARRTESNVDRRWCRRCTVKYSIVAKQKRNIVVVESIHIHIS